MPEIDSKTLIFAIALVQKLRNSKDEMIRDRYTDILSETLSIISRSEQLYTCQDMDIVITELHRLFISKTEALSAKDKEHALLSTTPSHEELELLSKEGMEVKPTVQKLLEERKQHRSVEADKQPNKRRKLPEGICRGVELLQNGMKRINEGLSELRSDESEEFQKSLLN
ncbi:hypothetical protein YC2023_056599 [Brassica napus]